MGEQSQGWSRIFLLLFVASLLFAIHNVDAQTTPGELFTKCVGCHAPKDGAVDVVAEQRKTPEGWELCRCAWCGTDGAQPRRSTPHSR